jgi:hypothetical protein
MTLYNVRIDREVQLVFESIEAESHEEAAATASDMHPGAADDIESCDGQTFSAQVDVAGGDDSGKSLTIEFEPERLRKAAPKLLAALEGALYALDENRDGSGPSKQTVIANAVAAIVEAKAAGITPTSAELGAAQDGDRP